MGQEDAISREPLATGATPAEPLPSGPRRSILRPTWARYRVLIAVCALAVIVYIHRVGFASAGPALQKALDLNDGQWGALMSAFLLAYGGFEVPWGRAGDRFGARHLLAAVALGSSLVTAALVLVALVP